MGKKRTPKDEIAPDIQESEWRCPGWGTAYSHAPNIRDWMAKDGSHDRRYRQRPVARGNQVILGEIVGGMAPSYGRCWKCKRSIGCAMCTTPSVTEVMCRSCAAWGTFEAFEFHGPIVANAKVPNPARFEEYPAEWRAKYTPPAKEFPWYKETYDMPGARRQLMRWNIKAFAAGLVKDVPKLSPGEENDE